MNAKSKHMLGGMRSIWGAFKNMFVAKPKDVDAVVAERAAARAAARSPGKEGGGGGKKGAAVGEGSGGSGGKSSSSSSSGSDAGGSSVTQVKSEEDELLEQISANVTRLGEMGRGIGAEVSRQDKQVDDLGKSIDKAGIGIKKNTKEANRQATR